MFYITEDELRFKQDTVKEYFNQKLNAICMSELFILKDKYPVNADYFINFAKSYFQFYLNRTYLDDVVVFFEDGSILKIHFNENGFSWSEHYDSQISAAFYYGRYFIRL